jgi:hypothetical protein
MEHISCYRSQETLNDTLRAHARRDGRPWTRDAVPMQNDLVPTYVDADAAAEMVPWYDDFARRYGIRLGRGVAAPAGSASVVAKTT